MKGEITSSERKSKKYKICVGIRVENNYVHQENELKWSSVIVFKERLELA